MDGTCLGKLASRQSTVFPTYKTLESSRLPTGQKAFQFSNIKKKRERLPRRILIDPGVTAPKTSQGKFDRVFLMSRERERRSRCVR